MNPEDVSTYIKRHVLFREVKNEGLKDITRHLSPAEVKKGNIIFFQGDRPESIYLIRSGFVKVSRITPEGRELTLSIFKANDLFGETAILNNSPHDTTAEALTNCFFYQIYRNQFLQILKKYPSISIKISSMVSQRMLKLEEKFQIAVSRDISSRIACVLLELADRFGEPSEGGTIITLPLTHLEIASLIGSTRETTCVTLNKFRRKGWVQSNKRYLVLQDVRALKSLCET
jgi:CRP/FNR family transcriptional regulator